MHAKWVDENGRWVFHGGHFRPVSVQAPPPPVVEEIIVQQAPPPPRTEVVPPAPSTEHVWLKPAHWQQTTGGWRFVGGRWR